MRDDLLLGEPGTGDVRVGDLAVTDGRTRVRWRGSDVRLTPMEIRLVVALASLAGEDVPYVVIHDILYGRGFQIGRGPSGYKNNIRIVAFRVRAKFRRADRSFRGLQNAFGVGYVWATPPKGGAGDAPFADDARRLAAAVKADADLGGEDVGALCDRILARA